MAITVDIFVLFIYTGMLLYDFCDPYYHLEEIPVAIVNEDNGYDYEGEHLTLGDELVDNLQDEDEFDFHFVDKATGYEGLEDENYYILIEIPEHFSEYATTVMDDHPKKIELIYKPNESYNFLASQIGETAMLQIEAALEEKIIETYAETIFDKIDDVADGLVEASEATEELQDGAEELQDGTATIKDSLHLLAEKTVEFTDGVQTAYDGAGELATGANKLSSGINELFDNSMKLKEASKDLQSGASELSTGMNEANNGVQEIKEKVPALISGTKQIKDGLKQFHRELPTAMSQQIKQQLEAGSKEILTGTDELRTGIVYGLENKLAPELSNGLIDGLSHGLAEGIVQETNTFINDAPEQVSNTIAENVTAYVKDKESEKKRELVELLKNAGVSPETMIDVEEKLDEFAPNYDHIKDLINQEIKVVLDQALENVEITEEQQNQLVKRIEEQIKDGITNGVDDAVTETVQGVHAGFAEYETALTAGLRNATNGLDKQIAQALNEPISDLQDGLTQLHDGQSLLQDGMNQLATGTNQLKDGSLKLISGQNDYVNNMQKFTESFAHANNGTNDVASGANDLFTGLFELQEGSDQLSDGTGKLSDGSAELYDGINTLVDGTEEFNEEKKEAVEQA